MERKSCGAILYTTNEEGELGIILGEEARGDIDGWLPFKGGCKENETVEQTAIRELYEETCGLVKLSSIDLQNKFRTKRKEYHIGLCEVPFSIIAEFETIRKKEMREEFVEKKRIAFFKFPEVLDDPRVHNISKASINFYKDFLESLMYSDIEHKPVARARYLGIRQLTNANNAGESNRVSQKNKKKLFGRSFHTKHAPLADCKSAWRSPHQSSEEVVS